MEEQGKSTYLMCFSKLSNVSVCVIKVSKRHDYTIKSKSNAFFEKY